MIRCNMFIVCFIVVNVAVNVRCSSTTLAANSTTTTIQPSSAPSGNACSHITVSNSLRQVGRHGLYEKLSSIYDCDGRPSYKQFGSSNYIFWLSSGHWVISETRCADQGGIAVSSTAWSPDRVTSAWQEVYGGTWMIRASIDVSCYEHSLCDRVKISNSKYQTEKHGIYAMLSSSDGCDGRPAYKLTGSSTYIYYDNIGEVWEIGKTRCGLYRGIRAFSTAISPDKVISTWQEYDGYMWVTTSALDVSCDSEDSSGVRIYAWLSPVLIVATIMPMAMGV